MKKRRLSFFILILSLVFLLNACNHNGIESDKANDSKNIQEVELETDENDDELSNWPEDRYAEIDDRNPERMTHIGQNAWVYNKENKYWLPTTNKYKIIYNKNTDFIDLEFYIPKGAKLDEINIDEAVYVRWKVDLKHDDLIEFSQKNKSGKDVQYFNLKEDNLVKEGIRQRKIILR
ncbi:MAG: hypothetical protein Q4E50_03895 [Tissierellia bacterium]|nr:hypothetical protein [Tissierellia bacterium]